MKRLLQFVALLVVALLAVPPAVAEGLCLLTQNQPGAMECCSSLEHISAPATAPQATIAQSCNEGCCSVAPATPASLTLPDKYKADSPTTSAPQAHADISLDVPRAFNSPAFATTGLTHDLPVLLHTFRI